MFKLTPIGYAASLSLWSYTGGAGLTRVVVTRRARAWRRRGKGGPRAAGKAPRVFDRYAARAQASSGKAPAAAWQAKISNGALGEQASRLGRAGH